MRSEIELFDAHCDSLTAKGIFENTAHLKRGDLLKYRRCLQVFAICAEYEYAYSYTMRYIGRFERLCRKWGFSPVKTRADLENARYGAILALEGANALCRSLAALDRFYNMGVRLLTITWNTENAAAGSIAQETDGGLTEYGKKLIRKCEKKGVVVDLSHIGDRSFDEVFAFMKKPFVCSHSNSRTVNPRFKRNLTDDRFKKLAKKGGVAGINFCCDFLGGTKTEDILHHIEHFLSLGGEKSIGFGSDFDGIELLPDECSGASFFETLYNAMLKRNYSETLVKDIMFNNFYRVFESIL